MCKKWLFQVYCVRWCTAVCERLTYRPDSSRVNGAQRDASQHAATQQLLGTLRFRRWDGDLLGSCSQLPSSPNTQRTLLSGDCSLFHYRPSHLHRHPAGPTGRTAMAVRHVEPPMQTSPLRDIYIKAVFFYYYTEV